MQEQEIISALTSGFIASCKAFSYVKWFRCRGDRNGLTRTRMRRQPLRIAFLLCSSTLVHILRHVWFCLLSLESICVDEKYFSTAVCTRTCNGKVSTCSTVSRLSIQVSASRIVGIVCTCCFCPVLYSHVLKLTLDTKGLANLVEGFLLQWTSDLQKSCHW